MQCESVLSGDDCSGETESRTPKPHGSRFRTERSHLSACLTTRRQSKLCRGPPRPARRDAATRIRTGDSPSVEFSVAGRCLTILGHRGRVGRRGFEPRLHAPKARVVVRWTIGPEVGCMSIPLRARRPCYDHRSRTSSHRARVGVLRVIPGMPHRTMQVADPSGPGTAGVIRYECTGGMCLPRWASPRVYERALGRKPASDIPPLGKTFARAPEDGRSHLPSPRSAPFTRTPTPGLEPGSRPRQGRMIAELHHVGYTAVASGASNSHTRSPTVRIPHQWGLQDCTQPQLRGRETTYQRLSVRSARTGRTFTPLSGANGSQKAASLAQLARPRTRHGPVTRVSAGGRPVFPCPERVVRVGGRVMRAAMSGLRRSGSRQRG